MGTTDDFFPSYSVVDQSINFWEFHHLGFTLFPPFQSLLWSPLSLIIPKFESDCVWLERGSEKLTFWALAFLSSDFEKLWAAGCVRFIYQEMEVCYAGNVVRWKTRINSLNKKRPLFLARRVIKGLRFCGLLWWRIKLQIPMFLLGYLARLKWIARVSIGLGRSFTSRRCLCHFNSCSHCSQNMGILSMLHGSRIN